MTLDFAKIIDHTLLKPDATQDQIHTLCQEARTYGFYSVCVPLCYVSFCFKELKGTSVKVCTVVGFPHGNITSSAKIYETAQAVALGAQEIDMVISLPDVKNKNWHRVVEDIQGVVEAASGQVVKVILETALLDEDEKIRACLAVKEGGAHFVKTSTGFAKTGATLEDVKLFRQTLGPDFLIKVSGGIRDLPFALDLIKAGANRLGLSSSVSLIKALTGGNPC